MAYRSKKDIAKNFLEVHFWPSNNEEEVVDSIPRADAEAYLMSKFGVSKGIFDTILETYARSGHISVTEHKIQREKDVSPADASSWKVQ